MTWVVPTSTHKQNKCTSGQKKQILLIKKNYVFLTALYYDCAIRKYLKGDAPLLEAVLQNVTAANGLYEETD